MKKSFTLDEYRFILDEILKKEFAFPYFGHEPDNKPFVILRHDVDFSLSAAVKLARIEKEFQIKGTYLIQLGSAFYNPLIPRNLEWLNEIKEYDHEIGLHHDATIYPVRETVEEICTNLNREKTLLETVLSISIRIISFHNPLENVRNLDLSKFGLVNTYAPKYYNSEICYVADSDMNWRDGYILDRINERDKIQWLVHPAHWDGKEPGIFFDRILNATNAQSSTALDYMSHRNRFWKQHLDEWTAKENIKQRIANIELRF